MSGQGEEAMKLSVPQAAVLAIVIAVAVALLAGYFVEPGLNP